MWKVSKKRIKELRAEFIHYDTLRNFVEASLTHAIPAGRRAYLNELLTLLDLAADVAEEAGGYSADAKLDALSGFLR